MWSTVESLYDLIYFIFRNLEDFKIEALLFYVIYLFGKRSGMKMFKKFLTGHFPYLADENEDWRKWATNQIELLGGRKWQPTRLYGRTRRSERVEAKNSTTSFTLSQEGMSPGRRQPMDEIIIATDDGHGLETNGKRTPLFEDGTFMHENEFNRAVVDKLNIHLKRNNFKVLHVSAGDSDVPLRTRTGLANNTIPNEFGRKSDAMVSVHANALGSAWNSKAKGIEIFYRDGYKEGKKLAQDIQEYLVKGTPLFNRGLKTVNLHITREANMPAVLVEGAFMDNPEEAKLLLTDAYRSECAEEIARGLCQYFGRTYIEETKLPELPAGMFPVDIIMKDLDPIPGIIINSRSWAPAKQVLNILGALWTFKGKSILINGIAVETKIINGTGYIKTIDLQSSGVARIFLDPDEVNTKRILIIPNTQEVVQ